MFLGDVLASTIGPSTIGWLFLYRRRIGAQLAWTLACFVAKAAILTVVIHRGVEACALSLSALSVVALCVGVILASRGTPVRPQDAWIPLAFPFVTAALAGTCVWLVLGELSTGNHGLQSLSLAMAVFVFAYALPWLIFRHGRQQFRLLWSIAVRRR
jgi:hypothetical protein